MTEMSILRQRGLQEQQSRSTIKRLVGGRAREGQGRVEDGAGIMRVAVVFQRCFC